MRSKNDAARRRLRANAGLTLIEMLVTVLLVTIAGGVIAATVDLSARHFRTQTRNSDAQLLCSALSLFVQNELTYAGDIRPDGSFTDHARGLGTGCSFAVSDAGHLVLNYRGGTYEPVGQGAYGKNNKQLAADCEISYSGGKAAVTITVNAADGTELTSTSFTVKPVAPGESG